MSCSTADAPEISYPLSLSLVEYFGHEPTCRRCSGCGAETFTVTSHRVACLKCYVYTRGSSVDRKTGFYPDEVVCGLADFASGVVVLDRPLPPRAPRALPEGADHNDPSVANNVVFTGRGNYEQYINPERADIRRARQAGAPIPAGPNSKAAKGFHESYIYHSAVGFVRKSEVDAARDRERARSRPRGRRRRADDPDMFSGGSS